MMQELPLSRVAGLLGSAPVVMLATSSGGRANVMAMAWLTMVEFEPPLLACVVGSDHLSFASLRASRECVIAVPPAGLADRLVAVGSVSGREVPDKFAAFGLTHLPATEVAAPLVDGCIANLECRIRDDSLAGSLNLFVLEVVKAWIDPAQKGAKTLHHLGEARFFTEGETVTARPPAPRT